MPDEPVPAPEAGDPPPAAEVVLANPGAEGDAADALVLREQLAEERANRKREQQRLAELEDENRRLKVPAAPATKQKRSWLDGATFFDPEA